MRGEPHVTLEAPPAPVFLRSRGLDGFDRRVEDPFRGRGHARAETPSEGRVTRRRATKGAAWAATAWRWPTSFPSSARLGHLGSPILRPEGAGARLERDRTGRGLPSDDEPRSAPPSERPRCLPPFAAGAGARGSLHVAALPASHSRRPYARERTRWALQAFRRSERVCGISRGRAPLQPSEVTPDADGSSVPERLGAVASWPWCRSLAPTAAPQRLLRSTMPAGEIGRAHV